MAKKRFSTAAAPPPRPITPSDLYIALNFKGDFKPMEHTRDIATQEIFHTTISPGFKYEDIRRALKEWLDQKTYQSVTLAYVSHEMRGHSIISFYKKDGTYHGVEALDKIMQLADNEITETRYKPKEENKKKRPEKSGPPPTDYDME